MSEQNQGIVLPMDLFNKIVDYLSSRPYKEVSMAIEEIRTSAQVVAMPSEEEKEGE